MTTINGNDNEEEGENQEKEEKEAVMDLIQSREYFLLVLWFSTQLIPLQYYVATIGFQMENKGDNSGKYTDMFSILYACSAIFAPILGKAADSFGLAIGHGAATILSSPSFFILAVPISLTSTNSD